MSFNIVEAVQAHLSPAELNNLSSSIGEPAAKTRGAVSTGILGVVGSVIARGASPSGSTAILDTLKSPMFGGGAHLTETFLGDKRMAVAETIAKSSGVSSSAAQRILTALLPITAGVLGREVIARKLGADGLFELLRGQRDTLMAIPGAGAIAGAVGLPALMTPSPEYRAGEYVRSVPVQSAPASGVVNGTKNGVGRSRWWLPMTIALGVLAVGGILLGRRGDGGREEASRTTADEPPVVETTSRAPAAVPTSVTTLTGADLPEHGAASDSVKDHFTGKEVPDKLTLSDVSFDFGTAELAAGEDAIEEISVQMKEHPTSTVRIEGHTDDVGDEEANEALSRKRAVVVKKMLVEKGVDANRVRAVGMGERGPLAPNDTEEGRAKNRRIDAIIIAR